MNAREIPTNHQVLLFYAYVTIDNPEELAQRVRDLSTQYKLTGRAIVAIEGINATLEGVTADTEKFVQDFFTDKRFATVSVKRSVSAGNSFPNLKVKVRNEIVGTGFSKEEANPEIKTAPRLSPDELRRWYQEQRDFVVVDMRNNYEFASGHFKDSVQAGISASRHLPLVVHNLEPLKNKTVVTVCTGGVRCEKMSAYLLNKGFDTVYQLEDGMHGYMEKYPGEDFLGTLYTFDQRVTMDFGGNREVIGTCHLCGAKSEIYTNCSNNFCHLHFIICGACKGAEGNSFCSEECKNT